MASLEQLECASCDDVSCGFSAAVVNKIYKQRLEAMLRDCKASLALCSCCGGIFNLTEHKHLICRGPQGAGPETRHLPDPSWKLQRHLANLRAQHVSWRHVYFGIWSVLHILYCHRCLRHFPACDLAKCSFHPEEAIYQAGKAAGRYPCCGGKAMRSGQVQLFSPGCCGSDHQVRLRPTQFDCPR